MICALAWAAAVPAVAQTCPAKEAAEPQDKGEEAAGDKAKDKACERAEPADEETETETCQPVDEEDDPVVVNGKRPLNRIDRQVYDVSKDPDNATGTTADALEKVPGVNVTPSGDVTLHGNSVEILVNGKPSPLFSGDNRAAALKAMPSGTVSSIEVMSNPGAQYGSSSAGGIINIVTKKAAPPGMFADVNAQVTSTGGYSAGGFLQYNRGRFATMASLNASDNRNRSRDRSSQAELDSNGQTLRSTDNTGVSAFTSRSVYGNATVDYDAGPYDTITGLVNVMAMSGTSRSNGETTIRNTAGVVTDQYESTGASHFDNRTTTLGLGWTRIGKTLGETLKLDAKVTRETMQSNGDFLMDYALSSILASGSQRRQPSANDTEATKSTLSIDYNGYIGDDQISAGAQIDRDDTTQDSLIFSPYAPGATVTLANPLLSNRFDYRQTISAAYVTYQKALGDHWVVLGGLRAEALDYESPDVGGTEPVKIAYTNVNPSLFATYVISDVRKIRLNYSRRLQRPTPYDLNPSLVYVNTQLVRVGAPALKPQEINSFEASYEYAKMAASYSVRLYSLDNDRMINPVTEIIPDPQGAGNQVVLVSRRNAGSSRQTGVQTTYSNSLGERWFVNANLDVYVTDMQVPDAPEPRSMVTSSGQFGVSYRLEKSTISLNGYFTGKRLTGDGYASGFSGGSLSWYRDLARDITLTVAVNDLFKPRETLVVRDIGSVRSTSGSRQRAPIFEIRLSRRFASGSFAPPKPEDVRP
ncbi:MULTISPECIES: TonB-dependent receptor [Asticcacaulis]|uniref:TonB-dependent receptor n=1 Tax=Asticcacaulis TaxID=76890 RepID=UPI001AE92803|nr:MULTISPECIES: TonB-dependent receptor [Asticcacaulis]MBP2158441.1 outer membrane receptor protein involved in Fe transport [Asticcacaulis solisilvae]MDR6799486.1 outer membrane receptor protein involved in Fe transport [Asticcacaulis sp. BE141]